jgi:RHS repeat-associated protein
MRKSHGLSNRLMRRLRFSFLILLVLLVIAQISHAQTTDFTIFYGETQSNYFESNNFTQRWIFFGEARDILRIQSFRIAGQFTPRLRLLDAAGNLLAESSGSEFSDMDEMIFAEGLPEDAPYQIEVQGLNVASNQRDNPAEYSLTLERMGQRRADPNEGLSPLPDTPALSELQTGDAQRIPLQFNVYGAQPQVVQRNTANIPNRWLITTEQWELAINNNIPVARGVLSATFTDSGIGLTLHNEGLSTTGDHIFFSDENFMVAYQDTRREYTFTLSDNRTIITDFFRIRGIQILDGFVHVTMSTGDSQRMVFNSDTIDIRQLSSGDTSEEPLNQIQLGSNRFVTTDLQGFHTLAFVDERLRVLFNDDARFISDEVRLSLRQNPATSIHTISLLMPVAGSSTPRAIPFTVDWVRMGDIRVAEGQISVEPLDGRILAEPIDNVSEVLLQNAGVRFTRRDITFRTSFPDGSDIETPSEQASNSDLLPYEAGFRPRNMNNLGADIVPLNPAVDSTLENRPVNPANGNFFYSVTDYLIPSHTLELNLTRYYNSQDSGSTPAYMLNGYPVERMGDGWRHSYQYELDISSAPARRIRLILPDGTQHLYFPGTGNTRWTSRTLLAVVVEQVGGVLGTWRATRTDGVVFHFDNGGRLTRISEAPDRSITISTMPIFYANGASGVFITEPYGRRLELYIGASGRIETARDTSARQIRYSYDGTRLVGVEYNTPTQLATYEYSDEGLLRRFDDVRSPYAQLGLITYDAARRVNLYIENSGGTLVRDYRYIYEQIPDGRITTRITTVNGQQRTVSWTYNALYQLVRQTTPRAGWDYEYTYDDTTGLLNGFRTPTLTRYSIAFDDKANITSFTDPFFTGETAYGFSYERRGEQSLLTQIRYPNNRVDSYTWSSGGNPRLLSASQLIVSGTQPVERITRYEYDEWGRVAMVVEPGNIATVYQYDTFGYVSIIWQGIVLENGETRTDILDSSRARRVLQLSYDLIGQLRAITDGRGQTYTLNWDSSTELLRQINGPDGVFITYNYDDRGRVTLVNDRGQETVYTYNGLDNITSVIDAAGVLLTFTYDEAGNLLSTVDDLQRETRVVYDELNNPTQLISPTGLVTIYETQLDTEGDFVFRREVDPAGRIIERRYDALGRLILYTLTDSDFSQEFRITYNSVHLPVSITEVESGRTITLDYDLIGQVQAIDVAGSRTSFTYDARGNLAQVTSPAGRVTRYEYDPLDNITRVILPDGAEWVYDYDENSNLLSATDTGGLTTLYVYDALNQLASIEDPASNLTSYDYDLRGNLTSIIDPLGTSRTFAYDALDRLVSATDGREQTTEYEYDNLGRLFNISQPGVRSTRLTYDAEDNIIAVTERPREQRTLYNYDVLGRITSITDPLGHTTTYQYNSLGRIIRIIDAIGNEQRYQWRYGSILEGYVDTAGRNYTINTDSQGRLTTLRDLSTEQNDAINTQLFYDADGYVQGIQAGTDSARTSGQNDVYHQYAYSQQGRIVRYTDPYDGVWQFTYDDSGRITEISNPRSVLTRYVYNDAGKVTQVIHQAGTNIEATEIFEYDANGNIIRYVSPAGVVNTYLYDQNDRLLQAVLAADTELESRYVFEYNALGQLIRTVDPLNMETRYFYSLDNLNRVERTLDDQTIAISYNYDDAGNLRNIVMPGRNEIINAPVSISMTYDALNRRVRYVNGADSVWSYTYNTSGEVAQISDPLGSVVRYDYDTSDRVTRITYPAGSAVNLSYDAAGNIRTITLPSNQQGTRQVLTYRLDANGNITEMQMGNSITRFEYDVMGNLTRRVLPDGRVTTFEYDSANRLTTTRYADGTVINYTYDAEGRLLSAGDTTFEYDALGRLQSQTNSISIDYTYDLAGNLLSRNAGDFGTTTYTYDDLYRPIEISLDGQSVQVVYDEMNQVRQIIRSNGVRTIINYDAAGRPISILHLGADNERLDGFNYQYDAVGNLIRVDRVVDGWRVLYSYDVAHRLIDERWLNEIGETVYNVSFRYDDAGNRIEENRNGQRSLFLYNDQNQLVGVVRNYNPQNDSFLLLPLGMATGIFALAFRKRRGKWAISFVLLLFVGAVYASPPMQVTTPLPDVRYEYDSSGNLSRIRYVTSRSGVIEQSRDLNLRYDNENRLIGVQGVDELGNDIDTELTYDQFSRLVNWRTGTNSYDLFYDGHELLGMTGAAGTERYLNFNDDRLLTVAETDTVLWHLHDQLGSTRRYADTAGVLIEEPNRLFEFGSFGTRIYPYADEGLAPEGSQVTSPSPFFAGHLYDPSTDLYLIGLRAYDPENGRFIQSDPLRQDPIGTLYTYARNRPFVFTDFAGMQAEPFLDPAQAASLAQDLEPESLIPRPDVPNVPLPPSVQRRQADETFRALQLLDAINYSVNDVVAGASPLLHDFYLFDVRPMPQAMRHISAQPLDTMMNMYQSGDGWLPDPRTNPTIAQNPFDIVREVEPLLAQAYLQPLEWRYGQTSAIAPILTVIPQPQPLSQRWQIESSLSETLQQIQVMPALLPQSERLMGIIDNLPEPELPYPTVTLPYAPVEPPVLFQLDDLREESFDLISRIWTIGQADCVDCVPPLGFSR